MASIIKGPEPVIVHALEVLEANMPAKLSALDLEFGDFPLAPIQAYYLGGSDGRAVWPSIAASEEDPQSMVEYASGQYLTYPVVFACLHLDDGSGFQQLMKSLYRYQRAMMEILRDHKQEAGYWLSITGVVPLADGPWPTEEDANRYAAVKGVRAWFTSTETF